MHWSPDQGQTYLKTAPAGPFLNLYLYYKSTFKSLVFQQLVTSPFEHCKDHQHQSSSFLKRKSISPKFAGLAGSIRALRYKHQSKPDLASFYQVQQALFAPYATKTNEVLISPRFIRPNKLRPHLTL